MKLLLPLLLLSTVAAFGQGYRRHNVILNAGAGIPRGELRQFFSTSPGIGFRYGYRFHPYFQAEAGYESFFGAADVRDWVNTPFGQLRIRDYQQFVPFGGRVIVPIANDRVQLHAGGGGAWFRYSERIRQPFGNQGFRLDCPSCAVRNGIGYYGLLGASFALDQNQHFRLGFGSKVYRGATDGDAFGLAPGIRTTDRWISAFMTFGVSF